MAYIVMAPNRSLPSLGRRELVLDACPLQDIRLVRAAIERSLILRDLLGAITI